MRGRSRVAQTLRTWRNNVLRAPGVSVRLAEVNGAAGALFMDAQHRLVGVWVLEITDGQIRSVNSIVNPEKLAHLGPLGDFAALLKAGGATS